MNRKRTQQTLYHLVLWLVALVFFAPVLWIILSSFKTTSGILATPPQFVFTPTFENYPDLLTRPNVTQYFLSSIVISLTSVVIALVVSFLAAYCFSRFKPTGTNFLMFLLLSIRMVPSAAVVIPVYLMYVAFGWRDTFWGMTLFYTMFSIPFSVWILKGFIDGVSPRYDETARVNGGSRLHILFRVILPQVTPGLVAAFIFNLIFVWNEFIFNLFLGGRTTTMIPVMFANYLYNDGGWDWPFVSTLTTVYMLLPIVAIFVFQKYLLVGMTFGTVRGEV
ncbi:MAG: carbohydrate ABC transporter permease [Phototrophicaceae bacterium]|jgi:multiple sugar transport system permease protein